MTTESDARDAGRNYRRRTTSAASSTAAAAAGVPLTEVETSTMRRGGVKSVKDFTTSPSHSVSVNLTTAAPPGCRRCLYDERRLATTTKFYFLVALSR